MKLFNKFSGEHENFVHDIAYDYYGKRLATCSLDHKIKVWSTGDSGEWTCEAELEGHKGSVWKLAWAHPEFGQILASCSFDQQVLIWEEQDSPTGASHTGNSTDETAKQGRWHRAAKLKDGRESVTDIQFAPRHQGLQIATCSADGYVRIFSAEDIMNLEHWGTEKFLVGGEKEEVTCIAWNPSRFDPAMLVVGTSGSTHTIKIWSKNEQMRRWEKICELSKHNGAVNDVCWAPNLGRSYHLIASASSDKTIKVWKVTKGKDETLNAICHAELPQATEVWRCEWNVSGTVLATSGDDGRVRLWRLNFQDEWVCVSEVTGVEDKEGS